MRRATSSLPLPDSPLMYSGAWLRASLPICLRRRSMGGEMPSSGSSSLSVGLSGFGWLRRRAVATSSRSLVRSTGLVKKSKAPALSALMAVSRLPKAVIMATGVAGQCCWIWRTMVMPSPSGRRMSVRHRSKDSASSSASACSSVLARRVSRSMRPSVISSSSRMSGSSSMISTVG